MTTAGGKELVPYHPQKLLTRWEGGSLYLGTISLPAHGEENTVWIFVHHHDFADTPLFQAIDEEDKRIAGLPHPQLPNQLDRGVMGGRPYIVFEGVDPATPLPDWRPELAAHSRALIFSKIAEIVLLLQSAQIVRPAIDPYRIMVFWDEQLDILDFRWLPLPDVGNYLHKTGFSHTKQGLLTSFVPSHPSLEGLHATFPHNYDALDASSPRLSYTPPPASRSAHALLPPHHPFSGSHEQLVARGPLAPGQGITDPGESTILPPPSKANTRPPYKRTPPLSQTDEFELISVLERAGTPPDDLPTLAKQLAELERTTRADTSSTTNPNEPAVPADALTSTPQQKDPDIPPLLPPPHPHFATLDTEQSVEHTLAPFSRPKQTPSSPDIDLELPLLVADAQEQPVAPTPTPDELPKQTAKEATSFVEEDEDEDEETSTLKPTPSICQCRYTPHMRVGQTYPLHIALPEPPVTSIPEQWTVTPVFPGCLVHPPSETWSLSSTPTQQQAQFWITPLSTGQTRLPASLSLTSSSGPSVRLDLPASTYKRTLPTVLGALGALSLLWMVIWLLQMGLLMFAGGESLLSGKVGLTALGWGAPGVLFLLAGKVVRDQHQEQEETIESPISMFA